MCESRGHRRVLGLSIVRRFGLGRRPVPDRREDPAVRLLNQSTHSRVANSTASRPRDGPRGRHAVAIGLRVVSLPATRISNMAEGSSSRVGLSPSSSAASKALTRSSQGSHRRDSTMVSKWANNFSVARRTRSTSAGVRVAGRWRRRAPERGVAWGGAGTSCRANTSSRSQAEGAGRQIGTPHRGRMALSVSEVHEKTTKKSRPRIYFSRNLLYPSPHFPE